MLSAVILIVTIYSPSSYQRSTISEYIFRLLVRHFALDLSASDVAALIAMNRPDQLRSHLARARDNGVTEQELIEAITHLAFYAGWTSAVTAVGWPEKSSSRSDARAKVQRAPSANIEDER